MQEEVSNTGLGARQLNGIMSFYVFIFSLLRKKEVLIPFNVNKTANLKFYISEVKTILFNVLLWPESPCSTF
ncbi:MULTISPECIES: hypothetical protein [Methanosarcina]|uniref:hypothetical protein n=1 Tax=Methanosarcina TaxID=2207 RepID=UPI00064F89A9|nr:MULTISPECIES: hypothetical protein [Methanosarcina]OED08891.1 hypothetical protein A9239_08795 [Methanosarcina sp. A14]